MTAEERKDWFLYRGWSVDQIPADLRIQVSVYGVDRCYGGPEEGGWYYDAYQFAGVSERVDIEEVDAAKERVLKLFEDEQPRYPISSVLSDGPEYRALIEVKAGEHQTQGRPRYS
jgi:hypothetical protein